MLVLIRLLGGEVINGGVFLAGSEVRVEQEEAARLIGLERAVAVETLPKAPKAPDAKAPEEKK